MDADFVHEPADFHQKILGHQRLDGSQEVFPYVNDKDQGLMLPGMTFTVERLGSVWVRFFGSFLTDFCLFRLLNCSFGPTCFSRKALFFQLFEKSCEALGPYDMLQQFPQFNPVNRLNNFSKWVELRPTCNGFLPPLLMLLFVSLFGVSQLFQISSNNFT